MVQTDRDCNGLISANEISDGQLIPVLDLDGNNGLDAVELSSFYLFKDSPTQLLNDVSSAFTPEHQDLLDEGALQELRGINSVLPNVTPTQLDGQTTQYENTLGMMFTERFPRFVNETLHQVMNTLSLNERYQAYQQQMH